MCKVRYIQQVQCMGHSVVFDLPLDRAAATAFLRPRPPPPPHPHPIVLVAPGRVNSRGLHHLLIRLSCSHMTDRCWVSLTMAMMMLPVMKVQVGQKREWKSATWP